jgi:hypothetical protein
VAEAVRESGRDVLILSQGYGDLAHFEWLFESACRKFGTTRLPMFGIACVDDREYLGEPVWGPGGMVEFLEKRRAEGRLGGIFCTTHGAPEYIARLVTSGCFDAIMLSYNALGFHLLSYHPDPSRRYEDIARNRSEIFPLAARHDVGLMIMKPLAGGLLCESKSFPPRAAFSAAPGRLTAAEVLRDILRHPEVASVVPGTSSVEEAEENARAGHEPIVLSAQPPPRGHRGVQHLRRRDVRLSLRDRHPAKPDHGARFVGRAHILQRAMEHTHYGPTYRGEVYSLAAARAALDIYRTEPVADHVWRFGERLRRGVNALCAELGVAAALTGPPFRMGLCFDEPDPHRLGLKRTLYQQELLKAGVITYDALGKSQYSRTMSSWDIPSARHARMNATERRVPRIVGLSPRRSGFVTRYRYLESACRSRPSGSPQCSAANSPTSRSSRGKCRGSRVSAPRHTSQTGLTPFSCWARRRSVNTGFRHSRRKSSAPGKRKAVRADRSTPERGPMQG